VAWKLLCHYDPINKRFLVKKLTKFCTVLLLSATCQFANSAPITYLINRVIPQQSSGYGNATVTGYITTNGTLGFISNSDITSFDIQTTVVGRLETRQSIHMTNINSFLRIDTAGLEATTDTLFLDFTTGYTQFGIRDVFAGLTNSTWTLRTDPRGILDETIAARVLSTGGFTAAPAGSAYTKAELGTTSGRQTQGALAASTSIPLPSSALLIMLGLGFFQRLSRKTR
jgi:hypothetical protein